MHGQRVLAVPRDRLASAGLEAGFTPPERADKILQEIAISGDFFPRSKVERDQSLLQPIPCGLIHSDQRVLVLERQEKTKTHRLHRRLVLWAGGHVQLEDALSAPPDLMAAALDRELREELDLATGSPELQGIVSDGRSLHFAVVYDVPAVAPAGVTVGANGEFRLSKGKSPSGYFLGLQELDRRYSQLEPWSRIILADILLRRRCVPPAEVDSPQLKFDVGSLQPAFLGRHN